MTRMTTISTMPRIRHWNTRVAISGRKGEPYNTLIHKVFSSREPMISVASTAPRMRGGYNPVNQIVGYILSGDPTYITSYLNARAMIRKLDRDELLEELVKDYLDRNE